MADLLDQAFRAARELPAATQNEIANLVLRIAGEDHKPIQLSPDEEASLAESLEQAERREFATDEQVRAIWGKHGL